MSERPAPYDPTTTDTTEPFITDTTTTEQQHPAACGMQWPQTQPRPIPFIALPLMQRDIVLLLPVLCSPRQEPGTAQLCLHLTTWKDGRLGFCNAYTVDECCGCGRSLCFAHWAENIYVPDHEGPGVFPLCETCAQLPREDVHALRALRFQMNEKG